MRRAFTLLEVIIAIAILAVALLVLVDTQAGAVFQTMDAQRDLVMTQLAQEKMAEVQMRVESEGFSDAEVNEEGTFEDFGINGEYGEGVELNGAFEDYSWAYTVRPVELAMGDMSGAMDQVTAAFGGESADASTEDQASENITSMASSFLTGDSLTDLLSPYIREARVLVWFGKEALNEDGCQNCVEVTTHFINPSGKVFSSESSSTEESSSTSTSTGTGGGTSTTTSGGKGKSR